jgi:VWFA-related protein
MPVFPPAAALEPAQVRRTIALVVDDLGLSFDGMARVRMSLKRFVDQEMQDGDLVAILRTGAGMGALQQFTSDKRLLAAAIDHLHFNVIGRVGVSTFTPLGTDPDPGFQYHGFEKYALDTMGALSYVVDGLRDLPGRKSMVLFSEDIRAASSGLMERANRASVVINCIDTRAPSLCT